MPAMPRAMAPMAKGTEAHPMTGIRAKRNEMIPTISAAMAMPLVAGFAP